MNSVWGINLRIIIVKKILCDPLVIFTYVFLPFYSFPTQFFFLYFLEKKISRSYVAEICIFLVFSYVSYSNRMLKSAKMQLTSLLCLAGCNKLPKTTGQFVCIISKNINFVLSYLK